MKNGRAWRDSRPRGHSSLELRGPSVLELALPHQVVDEILGHVAVTNLILT